MKGLLAAIALLVLIRSAAAHEAAYLSADRFAIQARIDRAFDPGLKELNLSSYIFRRDQTGLTTVAVLSDLARKGVKVRLLLDYFDSHNLRYGLNNELLKVLQDAGVDVRLYHKFTPFDFLNPVRGFQLANQRLHEKILTFNQDEAIIGGRNAADHYFFTARSRRIEPRTDQFMDREVYVKGAAAAQTYLRFMELWNSSEVTPAPRLKRQTISQSTQVLLEALLKQALRMKGTKDWQSGIFPVSDIDVFTDPLRKSRELSGVAAALIRQINMENESITVVNPYFLLTPEMKAAFQRAHARGVKLALVTATPRNNDMVIVSPEFERDIGMLLKMGFEIHQQTSFKNLHSKFILFGKEKVFLGSYNFDNRSQTQNTEIGYLITGKEFASVVQKDAAELIRLSFHRSSSTPPKGWECGLFLKAAGRILRPFL